MYQEIFLFSLAFVWILFASLQDIRKRIVSDWLNFSLIIFVLGFRFFYSLFESDGFVFFYQGLFGLGIFFILGNILYYAKFFGGGDAKLMMALGAMLPLGNSFLSNAETLLIFFLIFLLVGSFYGLLWSIFLVIFSKNSKAYIKKFSIEFKKSKKSIYPSLIIAILLVLLWKIDFVFVYFGILIFTLPYLYIHSKLVDNVFLVKKVQTSKLEEGDWIYRDLKLGKKILTPSWGGLTKVQIREIRKRYKSIHIRNGIPFIPVFLISFLAIAYLHFSGIDLIEIFKGFY
jgi:Flp pilus assembly protein protease CpaA